MEQTEIGFQFYYRKRYSELFNKVIHQVFERDILKIIRDTKE